MRHQWPVRVLAHIEWSNPPPANPDGLGGAPKRGVPLAATATLVYSDGASATFHCGFDAARRNFLEVRSPAEHAPILHYLAPISRAGALRRRRAALRRLGPPMRARHLRHAAH